MIRQLKIQWIFAQRRPESKEDYVIICGDFGGVWNKETESKQENRDRIRMIRAFYTSGTMTK